MIIVPQAVQTALRALLGSEQQGLITARVITDYVENSAHAFDRLTLAQVIFILYQVFWAPAGETERGACPMCAAAKAVFRAVRDNRV